MKKALFTTTADLSASLFVENGWQLFLYSEKADVKNDYDVVYFRDPMNDETYVPSPKAIDALINKFQKVKSIDNIRSFKQIENIEDKWAQARKYGNLMPKTFLPSTMRFIPGKYLAKKRLSQRAKDILFELDGPLNDQWIYQELLDIKEELRVYAVFGEVIQDATIKSGKASGKVKVIGGRKLKAPELQFCEIVAKKTGLDFIGIDLAVLKNGELKLIEINRSPQFKRFVEIYGPSSLDGIFNP